MGEALEIVAHDVAVAVDRLQRIEDLIRAGDVRDLRGRHACAGECGFDPRPGLLPFLDLEMGERLADAMRSLGVIVLGVILALLYEKTGSLYPAIALHALNNSIAFVSAAASSAVIR